MEKKDVGMVKRFSKKYGNKGRAFTNCNPKVMSRCLSAPDATCLQNYRQYFIVLSRIQALDTKKQSKGDLLLLFIQQL